MRIPALLATAVLALAAPAALSAHVSVASSTPAAGSTVKAPKTVSIAFNTPVDPASTAVSIVMTAMPGMPNHGEMLMRNYTKSWSADRSTMTLKLASALPKGDYEVRWKATGEDGHAVSGVVNFKVG